MFSTKLVLKKFATVNMALFTFSVGLSLTTALTFTIVYINTPGYTYIYIKRESFVVFCFFWCFAFPDPRLP